MNTVTSTECSGIVEICGCEDCEFERRTRLLDKFGINENDLSVDEDGEEYFLSDEDYTCGDGSGDFFQKKVFLWQLADEK